MSNPEPAPMTKTSYLVPLIALMTIAVFAKPLFSKGLIAGHDTGARIIHIQMMAQALKDGQFPVRWVEGPAPGLSHPLFNYYPPLFYYFPAVLNLAGAPVRDALYLSLIAFSVLGWYGMYKFTKSFLAASLFSFTPYRISQVYVRAAYLEFAATSLIPFVFWGIQKRDIKMTAISLGLMLATHQPTFMMVFPAMIAWIAFLWLRDNSKQAVITSLISIGVGLLLASSFVLPLFAERRFVRPESLSGNYFDYHQHFATLKQLIYSPWGYGISQAGPGDGMSFQVGILNWLVVMATVIFSSLRVSYPNRSNPVSKWIATSEIPPRDDKDTRDDGHNILFFLSITAYGVFMSSSASLPVWEAISPLSFIQYPWRFLAITTFATAVLAGEIGAFLQKKYLLGMVVLMILLNWRYLAPATYLPADMFNFNSPNFPKNDPLYGLEPSYFPIQTVQTNSDPSIPRFRVIQGKAEIKSVIEKTTFQQFVAQVEKPSTIQINTHYFPGWIAKIDGEDTTPGFSSPEGNMEVTLPPGEHKVTLEFTQTPVRKLGDYLSLGMGAILVLSLFWSKYRGAILAALKKSPIHS